MTKYTELIWTIDTPSMAVKAGLVLFIIEKNGLIGVCTKEGEILIAPTIDREIAILPDTYGEELVGFEIGFEKHERKCGFVDLEGNIVMQFQYFGIARGFKDGEATIAHDYAVRTIDKQGNTLKEGRIERESSYHDDNYDWKKDTWDALTDGMYGDYPEDGSDIDDLMERLGLD